MKNLKLVLCLLTNLLLVHKAFLTLDFLVNLFCISWEDFFSRKIVRFACTFLRRCRYKFKKTKQPKGTSILFIISDFRRHLIWIGDVLLGVVLPNVEVRPNFFPHQGVPQISCTVTLFSSGLRWQNSDFSEQSNLFWHSEVEIYPQGQKSGLCDTVTPLEGRIFFPTTTVRILNSDTHND